MRVGTQFGGQVEHLGDDLLDALWRRNLGSVALERRSLPHIRAAFSQQGQHLRIDAVDLLAHHFQRVTLHCICHEPLLSTTENKKAVNLSGPRPFQGNRTATSRLIFLRPWTRSRTATFSAAVGEWQAGRQRRKSCVDSRGDCLNASRSFRVTGGDEEEKRPPSTSMQTGCLRWKSGSGISAGSEVSRKVGATQFRQSGGQGWPAFESCLISRPEIPAVSSKNMQKSQPRPRHQSRLDEGRSRTPCLIPQR